MAITKVVCDKIDVYEDTDDLYPAPQDGFDVILEKPLLQKI